MNPFVSTATVRISTRAVDGLWGSVHLLCHWAEIGAYRSTVGRDWYLLWAQPGLVLDPLAVECGRMHNRLHGGREDLRANILPARRNWLGTPAGEREWPTSWR